MRTNNKTLDEKFQTIMYNDNTDLPDINYEGDRFKKIYSSLADSKVDEKLIKDMETTPLFKRPKDFDYYFVFSDVNFIYDADDLTLRSYGKIGVAYVGEKAIHKKLDGYIEIGLKNNNINIYLKTGANEWFYFEYKPNSLGLISSYDDYNKIVGTMIAGPSEKRKITGDKGQWYLCNLGSTINKGAFLDAMKEKNSPLLPQEKARPRIPRDSAAIKAKAAGMATPPAATKPAQSPADSAKAAIQKAEDAMTPAQRRAAKLRAKAGQDEVPAPVATPPSPAPTDSAAAKPPVPVPAIDTTAKTIKQPDALPVTAPAVTPAPVVTPPADTSAKTLKQPEATPVAPPVVTPPTIVTPPADSTSKKPLSVPVVPIDSSTIKQPVPIPADTSGHN
jgi:hypothetical protein